MTVSVNGETITTPRFEDDDDLSTDDESDQSDNKDDPDDDESTHVHPSSSDVSYDSENEEETEPRMDRRYGRRSSDFSASRNLRPRRKRSYRHLFNTIPHKPETYDFDLEETVMTQLGFEKGLKEYGAEARQAVVADLKQLHDKGAVDPIQGLTRNQKRDSLRYLMYITKKKTGRTKARGCADGRKQF